MNKVLNINLGGMPITIDDDAYRYLENYLQTLHNHFRDSEGYEEIIGDIEARMAELLREGMGKRSIANIQDVKNAVSVMGTPEDFGAEPLSDTTQKSKNTGGASHSNREGGNASGIKTGKRLFRDSENQAVGGVCSGIAAYFGIEDPLWVRLAFLGLIFLFGTSFLLYFILWAIVPEAKTTADKLAMKGETIDVNSIAKSVETGFHRLSEEMNQFGNPENQAKFQSQMRSAGTKLSRGIQVILRGIGGIWKVVISIIAIILIITMIVSWVSGAIGLVMAYPLFSYVTDSNIAPPIAIFCAFLSVSIPIILLLLFLSRLLLKRPASNFTIGSLWTVFSVAISILAIMGGRTAKEFNQKAEFTKTIELPNPTAQILTISSIQSPYGDLNTEFGDLKISDDFLLSEDVQIRIVKTEGDKFELVKTAYSRGKNQEESRRLVDALEYKMDIVGDELRFSDEFQIPKGTKWRDQTVNFMLKVPVGKRIKIKREDDMPRLNLNFNEAGTWKDNRICWDWDETQIAIWEMTPDGLKCMNPKKKTDDEDEDEDE